MFNISPEWCNNVPIEEYSRYYIKFIDSDHELIAMYIPELADLDDPEDTIPAKMSWDSGFVYLSDIGKTWYLGEKIPSNLELYNLKHKPNVLD